MWPFNKKTTEAPQPAVNCFKPAPQTMEDATIVKPVTQSASVTPKAPSVEAQSSINEAIGVMNQEKIEEQMINYIKSKGFDVTPSGTQVAAKDGIISKAAHAVEDTAVGTFHVARGVVRKVSNTVSDKVNELKTLGS
jgi:hypothetical protein